MRTKVLSIWFAVATLGMSAATQAMVRQDDVATKTSPQTSQKASRSAQGVIKSIDISNHKIVIDDVTYLYSSTLANVYDAKGQKINPQRLQPGMSVRIETKPDKLTGKGQITEIRLTK
jgi:hypothetical protein